MGEAEIATQINLFRNRQMNLIIKESGESLFAQAALAGILARVVTPTLVLVGWTTWEAKTIVSATVGVIKPMTVGFLN